MISDSDRSEGRCIATKPRLDPTLPPKQCPRPAKYGGEWCRQHAESLGGWRLAPPGAPLDIERLVVAVLTASNKHQWSVYRTEGGVSWKDRRQVALEIAAEYAALIDPAPSEGGEGRT